MENLSNLISKQIVSIEEGKYLGYILNVYFDNISFKLNGFLVSNDEDDSLKFLDEKNVICISDYILIKSSQDLSFGEMIEANNPIGKVVLTDKGEFIGHVKDVIIEKEKIKKIITKNCEINPQNIQNFEGNYLFLTTKKRKKRSGNFAFNYEKKDDIKVKIMANKKDNNFVQSKKILQNKAENNFYKIPFKSKFLTDGIIGKMATEDIFGKNKEIIIRKNEIITEKTLKNAKKHGKENLLIFNSK